MRRGSLFVSCGLILSLLVGCGQSSVNPESVNSTSAVSLSMTDEPPSGVTVLFFQISLTAASLTPASSMGTPVSLLNNDTPIQVDVTQLQALSAFLSTANVSAGTYNSLTLTFASPQLVIFNAANQSIASTCPVGSVCQLTPQIDNSPTLTFSSAPFPVTVGQNTPVGLLLDFHLNNVIQSDLSVNLGVTNGVTVGVLPSVPPPGHPPFGFLEGTVQSVNSSSTPNQFTLQTRDGRSFTIDVNSSTTYGNFPSAVCATGAFSCLAAGQIVKVQVAGVQGPGMLLAAEVDYVGTASQQVVEGNIIGLTTANDTTVMTLLLHWSPNATTLPFGGMASVTVSSSATFSVDSDGFMIPAGLSFASATDLLKGQDVQVDVVGPVVSDTVVGRWIPPSVSFSTDSIELEPSQITGTVTAVDSTASTFTISTFPNFFPFWSSPTWMPAQVTVDTTSQTTYQGLTPDTFAGLTANGLVSVNGWLFSTPSGPTPSTVAAQMVLGRPTAVF